LNVIINRPLDALDSNGQWRLASCSRTSYSKYRKVFEDTLAKFEPTCEDKTKIFFATLIRDMERERHNYNSIYHYQQDLNTKILPMINERLAMTRDTDALI